MPAHYQYSSYIYNLGLSILSIYAIVATFNAWVDPRGYFIRSSGSEPRYYTPQTRLEKSIRLAREQYDIIVVGSSRVEVGIDPESKVFADNSVYNLGLSATNMYELSDVIDYLLENQSPQTIILGLDFLMFSSQRHYHPDFHESLFSKDVSYISVLWKYLVNMQVFKEAILSTWYRVESRPTNLSSRGYLNKEGERVDHRQLFDAILRQNFFIRNDTYAGYEYSSEREKLLADAIQKIISNGINLKIFFSPIHARQEDALAVSGLYQLYETWKVNVVRIVASHLDTGVRLCDFGGYTTLTTEPIPASTTESMRWYWESSHYKKELGDRIVTDLFKTGLPSIEQANCNLTNDTIQHHLAAIRERRKEYHRQFPLEVQEVGRIYAETAEIRAKNLQRDINGKLR